MAISQSERRHLYAQLLGVDVTGKSGKELHQMVKDHKDGSQLNKIAEKVIDRLSTDTNAEERVKGVLGEVLKELSSDDDDESKTSSDAKEHAVA
mgnify:FL=1